jgi:hypothetical protein
MLLIFSRKARRLFVVFFLQLLGLSSLHKFQLRFAFIVPFPGFLSASSFGILPPAAIPVLFKSQSSNARKKRARHQSFILKITLHVLR